MHYFRLKMHRGMKTPIEEIGDFVDKYITCANDELLDDMKNLVNLQMHRHAKTVM